MIIIYKEKNMEVYSELCEFAATRWSKDLYWLNPNREKDEELVLENKKL